MQSAGSLIQPPYHAAQPAPTAPPTPSLPRVPPDEERSKAIKAIVVVLACSVAVWAFGEWAISGFSNPYGQPQPSVGNVQADMRNCDAAGYFEVSFSFTLGNSGDRAANVGIGFRLNGTPVTTNDYYAPAHSSRLQASWVGLGGGCPSGFWAPDGILTPEVRVLQVTPA